MTLSFSAQFILKNRNFNELVLKKKSIVLFITTVAENSWGRMNWVRPKEDVKPESSVLVLSFWILAG